MEHSSHFTHTNPSFSVTVYFALDPSPRPRLAVAREGADFEVFASRASIIAPSSLALTVTTRAVGSRQFASHACGGGRADKVFAPRAMSRKGARESLCAKVAPPPAGVWERRGPIEGARFIVDEIYGGSTRPGRVDQARVFKPRRSHSVRIRPQDDESPERRFGPFFTFFSRERRRVSQKVFLKHVPLRDALSAYRLDSRGKSKSASHACLQHASRVADARVRSAPRAPTPACSRPDKRTEKRTNA